MHPPVTAFGVAVLTKRTTEVGSPADRVSDRVRELLQRIADAAGVDADVEVRQESAGVSAEYVGDDLAVLIGHHGQTIDAIQHLAYRVALAVASRTGCRSPWTPLGTASAAP